MVSSSVERGKTFECPEEWTDRIYSWQLYNEADGNLGKGTLELYAGKLTREFLPWLAGMGWQGAIEDVSVELLREYMLALERKGLSGATRLVSRGAVRSLWKFLRADDYIQVDPFEAKGRIPRPKADDHVVPVLAPEDIDKLLRTAAKDPYLGLRDVALLSVLVDSGLRVSELCGLTVDDVDWREGRLFVRHGKGGRERVVSLGRHAMRALDKYRRWRSERMRKRNRWAEPCDLFFVSRDGSALKDENVRGRLKTIAKRAGLDPRSVWPHKLRHTAATALADAGMGESELRMLFGWTRDSGMVERYTASTTAQRALRNHQANSPLDRLTAPHR